MAKPVSPVVPELELLPETVIAKDQPEYLPLPAYRYHDDCGTIVTRWRFSFRERLRLLLTGNLWVTMLTFYGPVQPLMLEVDCPVLNRIPCEQKAVAND